MKIFYAVQATGNGHIARAMELVPYLQQYGEVDIFLSGSNSSLDCSLPVKYRSKGLCLFYSKRGGLDYWKMYKELSLKRVWNEAKALPVEKYDVVINDFECITSLACKLKKIPSINFGHQASFKSANTPRPDKKDMAGELVLQRYAIATEYVGLHFEQYDNFIFSPIIKDDILKATPTNDGSIVVYLSHYCDAAVTPALKLRSEIEFKLFSKEVKNVVREGNITYIPVSSKAFNDALINCHGVITGGGFETPAEALYMGKQLMCIPIKGQYEQLCNSAALQKFDVPVIDKITKDFHETIWYWLEHTQQKPLTLSHSTYEIVQHVMEKARVMQQSRTHFPSLITEEDLLVMG